MKGAKFGYSSHAAFHLRLLPGLKSEASDFLSKLRLV
jgi:hypothetical protein